MADIDPIKAILGLFVMVIFGAVAVIIISALSSVTNQDQCKPIQEQASQLATQVNADYLIINQTNLLLEQCRANYTSLANQTITRGDFEEIKGYFNLTQAEIETINKKIDGTNKIYNLYNINIKNYSIAFNIILSIEVLSFLLVKNEFAVAMFNWIRKKKKEKEHETAKVQTS